MSPKEQIRSGKKYAVVLTPRPCVGECVFFTHEEMNYIFQQNLSEEEWLWLWNAKKLDFKYEVLPEIDKATANTLAQKHLPNIYKMLGVPIE